MHVTITALSHDSQELWRSGAEVNTLELSYGTMAIVSARDAGPAEEPRQRLVAEAIRLLESGGPEALQARRVASAVNASTMAVYTHFGGMGQLIEAVAREGLARLSRTLAAVPETPDGVEDIFEIAMLYRAFAIKNPQLFRVMYGVTEPGGHTLGGMDEARLMLPESLEAFDYLARAVRRAIESAGGCADSAATAAMQIWCAGHGYVLAELAGFFGGHEYGLQAIGGPLLAQLVIGLGHPPETVHRALRAALARHGGD